MTCLFICLRNEWKEKPSAKTDNEGGKIKFKIPAEREKCVNKFKWFACAVWHSKLVNKKPTSFLCLVYRFPSKFLFSALPFPYLLSILAFDRNQSHRDANAAATRLLFAFNGGGTYYQQIFFVNWVVAKAHIWIVNEDFDLWLKETAVRPSYQMTIESAQCESCHATLTDERNPQKLQSSTLVDYFELRVVILFTKPLQRFRYNFWDKINKKWDSFHKSKKKM